MRIMGPQGTEDDRVAIDLEAMRYSTINLTNPIPHRPSNRASKGQGVMQIV